MTIQPSSRSAGVIVLSEFIDLRDSFFIREIVPDFPQFVYVKWRNPSQHREEGIHLIHGQYSDSPLEGYDFHLFALPEALVRDYLVRDLQFPVNVLGAICIIDFSLWRGLIDQEGGLGNICKDPRTSGIAWTRANHLPFVVATIIGKNNASFSVDEVRKLCELESDIPVHLSSKSFDKENVRLLLSILAQQIRAKVI